MEKKKHKINLLPVLINPMLFAVDANLQSYLVLDNYSLFALVR